MEAADYGALQLTLAGNLVTEREFLYFSGRCLGNLLEDDLARTFEMGQQAAAMGDDFGFGQLAAGLEFDNRARRLAPGVVGAADYRRFKNCGVFVEYVLNFDSTDVFAAGNYDIFGAVLSFTPAVE